MQVWKVKPCPYIKLIAPQRTRRVVWKFFVDVFKQLVKWICITTQWLTPDTKSWGWQFRITVRMFQDVPGCSNSSINAISANWRSVKKTNIRKTRSWKIHGFSVWMGYHSGTQKRSSFEFEVFFFHQRITVTHLVAGSSPEPPHNLIFVGEWRATWMSRDGSVRIKGERINGLGYNLLTNGIKWGIPWVYK